MPAPVIVIHAGAGASSPPPELRDEAREALRTALRRGAAALDDGGEALDAVQVAVAYMEDEVEFFNAGRGAVLCADGTAELSAALMRGHDRAAGAVAIVTRCRYPVAAARAVLEVSDHVLMMGRAADRFAHRHGVEACEPEYFVTERQRVRLAERGSDFERGTVGAVCLDGVGRLAAATSTGGRRGQLPGRVGDTPVIGAGTWADRRVAVSCTGDGESFIRAGAAHQLADRVAAGEELEPATEATLADVGVVDGTGGIIAVDARGAVALAFTSDAMNRGVWREGSEPEAWV
ncbi:MAG TPA: isoaspartyl peptidase/L-asparaginase [Solirubrobacteraceae bacterium]